MKEHPLILMSTALGLLLSASATWAEGDPEAGRKKAETCQACHGLDGHALDPNYPELAGQHESYLIKALADYRSGERDDAIMASFVRSLSNQDIEDLAAWYASQEGLKDLSIK